MMRRLLLLAAVLALAGCGNLGYYWNLNSYLIHNFMNILYVGSISNKRKCNKICASL